MGISGRILSRRFLKNKNDDFAIWKNARCFDGEILAFYREQNYRRDSFMGDDGERLAGVG